MPWAWHGQVIKWVFALQKVTNPNFLKIGNHLIFSGQFWDLTVEARSPTAVITGFSGQTALLSLLLHIFNPIVWLHTHTELEYLQIWRGAVNGLLLLVTWPSTRLWLAAVADHSISTAMLWLWWIRTGMYHQVLTLTQRGNTIIQAEGKFIPGIIHIIVNVEDSSVSECKLNIWVFLRMISNCLFSLDKSCS